MREDLTPALRLRLELNKARGPRFMVRTDDLRAVLDSRGIEEPPQVATEAPAEIPRVILPVDREHAFRLARAAWESDPSRSQPWDSVSRADRELLADAAGRALAWLADREAGVPVPRAALPGAREVPAGRPVTRGQEEPPY